jgi:tetraacyldisaccharide 4'-kinase
VSVSERVEAYLLRAAGAETPTADERVARGCLCVAALVYGGVLRARNGGYNAGLFRTSALPCRVISVGNITVGGTGKTPTVIALASAASAASLRTCILLRGYGRAGSGVAVVSDGRTRQLDWREAGDEAVLLAERLPGVPVIVGGDRVAAGKLAVERFHPDLILLDDGFQHRRIHRDADLVLLDATDPFGGGRLLPRGRLREAIAGLRRARAFLVTRADQGANVDEVLRRVRAVAPGRPIGLGVFRPVRLRARGTAREGPVTEIRGKRVLAVSGIANPGSFHRTLSDLGALLVGDLVFRDHHPFDAEDRRRMAEAARREGAEWIVTTEKDAVRLEAGLLEGFPVVAVGVDLEIVEGAGALEAALGLALKVVGGV